MAGPGGGPSRRSHTKSRKGCKTCKRRHIRCDETMPQCRNCIKHNCPCDYLESSSAGSPSFQTQLPVPNLSCPPEIEPLLEHWQKTGICSLGDAHVDLQPYADTFTRTDLILIYHILRSGQNRETNAYTVWTSITPRFLAMASEHTFLMHAILSFAGAALAFEAQTADAKSVAYHYGGLALKGLQTAITNYSQANADAVLGASILLSWQANDWTSWASLITGIRTVVNSMRAWRDESVIQDIILEQELSIPEGFPTLTRTPAAEDLRQEYDAALQQLYFSFEALQPLFYQRELETKWIEQLKDYFLRLRNVSPAQTPEEQFNYLYAFRKWVFWIPSNAIKSQYGGDYLTLILLAHLYAAALALEPLFLSVAPAFCSLMVLRPLEEIIKTFDPLSSSIFHDQHTMDMLRLMEYPKQVLANYQARKLEFDIAETSMRRTPPGLDRLNLDLTSYIENYGDSGHYSPAFMPSPLSHTDPVGFSSSPGSAYLNIPGNRLSGYSTSSYDSSYIPSPSYQEDYYFRSPETPHSAFVAQQFLWT